jgi:hypothetical protein
MLSRRKTDDFVTNQRNKMKKAILAVLSATLLLSVTSTAQAEDQRVLAIIDTAINSDIHPSVVYEACFTVSKAMACPNGQTFMEGKGAAKSPFPASINNNTYHGDSMAKAALAVNPNLKIVFVRVADVNAAGNTLMIPASLILAIDWVSKNASKYSIDAVSISLSGVNATMDIANATSKAVTASAHCTNQSVINSVSSMALQNIPTFASTGNNGSRDIVGFPACIPGVIGVGALSSQTDESTLIGETATNRGPGLDMVANGNINITKYNGSPTTLSGSSGANVVSASTFVKNNTYTTVDEYVSKLSTVSVKFLLAKDAKGALTWEPTRVLAFNTK